MVGDGISIDVGMDSWVPSMDGLKPIPKDDSIALKSLMVSSLINPRTHNWKEDDLMDLFDMESIEAIKRISIPLMPRKDKLVWFKDPKGCFYVKSAYRVSQETIRQCINDVLGKNYGS